MDSAVYGDAALRDRVHALLRGMADDVTAFAKSVGGDMDFVYMNYADADQDPIATYGAQNVQLLRDVAAKYDPEGVFQTRVSGGFKVSNVE